MSFYQPSTCSCKQCQTACYSSPCLGTPHDIYKLIRAGYQNSLSRTSVLDPVTGRFISILAITGTPFKHKGRQYNKCSLLTPDNLCPLHNLGLKPLEGKLISCCGQTPQQHNHIRHMVLNRWRSFYNKNKTII